MTEPAPLHVRFYTWPENAGLLAIRPGSLAVVVSCASYLIRSQRSPPCCPRLFGQSCEHHQYHSPLTAYDESGSILVGRSVLPLPAGALRIADAPVGKVASPPCRRFRCGSSEPPWASSLSVTSVSDIARPAPVPLLSLLPSWILSQCTTDGLYGVKAKPSAPLRVTRRLVSLDTSPSVVEALRKKEAKKIHIPPNLVVEPRHPS